MSAHHPRRSAHPVLGLLGALVLSACLGGNGVVRTTADPPGTGPAPTTTTTTTAGTTPDRPVPVDVVGCDRASEPFELLCRVHEILTSEYVDPVEDVTLAAGASRGLEEHGPPLGESPPSLTCSVPSPAYRDFCQAYAERVRPGSEGELIEAAVRGMLEFGVEDPFSRYLDPEQAALEREDLSGRVEGIGALVRTIDLEDPTSSCRVLSETCALLIVEPLEDGPAERVGIRPGDRVVSVDGELVDGWNIEQLVSRVRGAAGTEVTLEILRDGSLLEVSVTREAVRVPIIEHRMLEDGIGYLRLLVFTSGVTEQVEGVLEELRRAGAKTLLFDLQDDPGGFLHEAIGVAEQFLDGGVILIQRSADDEVVHSAEPGGGWVDREVIVLVNRGTASAAEVVAAALQESGRAIVTGEETFGKGSVQQDFDMPNGSVLKLTVAAWLTPGGRSLAGQGIEPDVPVVIPPEADQQFLLDRTLEWLEHR